jgi:hypothetical protein
MAQGATILARWATLLAPTHGDETQANPYPAEITYWTEIATEFTVKTQLMWRDGWFRDYDSVARVWSSERDAMHLAPVFCSTATGGHIEQLRPILAEPPSHSSQWAPLNWPPVVLTLIGATSVANMHQEAAELAYRFIDASYRSTDSRQLDEHGGLPGVTREYRRTVTRGKWDETDYVNAGIEGYGWGTLSVYLLMRHVLGLQAHDTSSIEIMPMLPQALRKVGATYTAGPIPWGNYFLYITYIVQDAQSYRAKLRCTDKTSQSQDIPQQQGERVWDWKGLWGDKQVFQLNDA